MFKYFDSEIFIFIYKDISKMRRYPERVPEEYLFSREVQILIVATSENWTKETISWSFENLIKT